MQDLGGGTMGWVIGAHKQNGRLQMKFFEGVDYQAAKEYYNPKKYTSLFKPDFSTEVSQVF